MVKPDPEGSNVKRAALAALALEIVANDPIDEEPFAAMSDLLADLMHWADFHDLDFDDCLRMARINHEEETTADEEEEEEDA